MSTTPTPGQYLPRQTRAGLLPLWQCCGVRRSVLPAVHHLAEAHAIRGSAAWLALDAQRQQTAAMHALRLRLEGPTPTTGDAQ